MAMIGSKVQHNQGIKRIKRIKVQTVEGLQDGHDRWCGWI